MPHNGVLCIASQGIASNLAFLVILFVVPRPDELFEISGGLLGDGLPLDGLLEPRTDPFQFPVGQNRFEVDRLLDRKCVEQNPVVPFVGCGSDDIEDGHPLELLTAEFQAQAGKPLKGQPSG